MDLIDRQAAIDAMKDTFKGTMVGTRVAVDAINRLPSAEKSGKWIGDKCSVCGEERAWYGCNPSYCPDCGCRMEREEE